jgi:hypothetical protein
LLASSDARRSRSPASSPRLVTLESSVGDTRLMPGGQRVGELGRKFELVVARLGERGAKVGIRRATRRRCQCCARDRERQRMEAEVVGELLGGIALGTVHRSPMACQQLNSLLWGQHAGFDDGGELAVPAASCRHQRLAETVRGKPAAKLVRL